MTFGLVIKFREVGNPSQGEQPLLRRSHPDVVVLSALGAEISTKFPHIWNSVGPVWANAMLVLMGHDSEKSDEDESDSAYEKDHSYKPVYRARDLVKWLAVWLENDNVVEASVRDLLLSKIHEWLDATEEPEDLLERLLAVKSTYVEPEKPPIIYNLGVLDLPSELIVDIIQLALQDDPHIVTTLSHVNSAFRTFTLSTPTLWTAIDIMFHENRISAHLERSRSAPLRVRASLTLLTMTRPQGLTKLATLIKMIRQHTSRIACLEMLYTNSVWGKVALHYFAKLGRLPNLDKFEYGLLLHQHFQGDGNLRARCKPRRISLEGLTIKAFRELYSKRVISLKVAKCKEIGMTDWEAALRSMPSLQRLEISDFKIEDPDPGEGADFDNKISLISLLHLQTLSLSRVPRAALIILLEALQTPNLTSATISFLEPDGLRDHSTPAPKLKPQPTKPAASRTRPA
ncbi:hypothetical protein M407DRAFT_17757 [Tulasnella calospora MUT 4182]|uniref:F-box domain-containing protein n=1 Tax=Tulasnella calospora MUT 4182 TaxID=1051891 RepID=A0A0C3QLB2_9AGAM|nr:hypothetical protein M407DRAFT_17757 [Tulasnella calospora MUT 4182]